MASGHSIDFQKLLMPLVILFKFLFRTLQLPIEASIFSVHNIMSWLSVFICVLFELNHHLLCFFIACLAMSLFLIIIKLLCVANNGIVIIIMYHN